MSLLGSPAPAPTFATDPPAGRVRVEVTRQAGSGCPDGTVSADMSPTNTRFRLQESANLALVGVGARSTDARKYCQISLRVAAPPGYAYAVWSVTRYGYASLADGATGQERDRYHLQGTQTPPYDSHAFVGPRDDTWSWRSDVADETALAWTPCGEQPLLLVDSELRVFPGSSDLTRTTSYLSKDSLDEGAYGNIYDLVWRRC